MSCKPTTKGLLLGAIYLDWEGNCLRRAVLGAGCLGWTKDGLVADMGEMLEVQTSQWVYPSGLAGREAEGSNQRGVLQECGGCCWDNECSKSTSLDP